MFDMQKHMSLLESARNKIAKVKLENESIDLETAFYQEDMKKKRQEQLDKRSQISIGNPLRFSATVKKDPDRGMGWVDAHESINRGRLGHSQSWKYKEKKKYNYYG
jgi:hypothetical protein